MKKIALLTLAFLSTLPANASPRKMGAFELVEFKCEAHVVQTGETLQLSISTVFSPDRLPETWANVTKCGSVGECEVINDPITSRTQVADKTTFRSRQEFVKFSVYNTPAAFYGAIWQRVPLSADDAKTKTNTKETLVGLTCEMVNAVL